MAACAPIVDIGVRAYPLAGTGESKMKKIAQQGDLVLSAVIMAVLAAVTLFAMVIAPPCTGIMQKADTYKIASLCFFLGAYRLLVWRRRSAIAAVLLPTLQVVSGLLFASYLNSLPLDCPMHP